AFAQNGEDVINYVKVIPIFLCIFLAPMIGMFLAYFLTILIMNICRRSNHKKAEKWFRRLQLVSSALFSLGHGGNDAQKVMGIIGAAVIFYHVLAGHQDWITAETQFSYFVDQWGWVPFVSFLVIGLGTMSGGWKIVKTIGTKITKVTPLEGVAAETSGEIGRAH